MTTTTAATQANRTAGTIRRWCRTGVITATKTAGRWVIDAASLLRHIHPTKKETKVSLPIVLNTHAGVPVAGGPADQILAAIRDDTPLTIGGRECTGDVVWLRGRQTWVDDAITLEYIARTIEHPQAGTIHYAWIDLDRLDQAPGLAAKVAEADREYDRVMARAAASTPSCDYCGDCPECI
ncbi:MAG TPA: hypothetical protein VIS06_09685 [Mycobacteriales bacterium]